MNQLNWFERWMLKSILRKIIRTRQIAKLFGQIRTESHFYFYEDNYPTQEDHLFREYLSQDANPDRFPMERHQVVVLKAVLKDLG